jgi:hypothetical protein
MPSPNAPSMTMALEKYILEANKGKYWLYVKRTIWDTDGFYV